MLPKTVSHSTISSGRVVVTTPSVECRELKNDTLLVAQGLAGQIVLTPDQALALSVFLKDWGATGSGLIVSR